VNRGAAGLLWLDAIPPLAYTMIFAVLWWLNEVYAVNKLQRLHRQVLLEEETNC
jgi:hypothetical protein